MDEKRRMAERKAGLGLSTGGYSQAVREGQIIHAVERLAEALERLTPAIEKLAGMQNGEEEALPNVDEMPNVKVEDDLTNGRKPDVYERHIIEHWNAKRLREACRELGVEWRGKRNAEMIEGIMEAQDGEL